MTAFSGSQPKLDFGSNSCARAIVAVNTSDSTDLTNGTCRGLLVGTAGAATIIDASGNTATLIPLQAGYNPIGVSRVFVTGLTAANLWALY
jgi:hypothetical protein